MHVALVTHEYPPRPHGGFGTVIADLAEALVSRGHQATVFAIDPKPNGTDPERVEEVRNGVKVLRLAYYPPKWMRWRPGQLWRRWKLLREIKQQHSANRIDVLETADFLGWLPIGKVRGVPTITRMQGTSFFYDDVLKFISTDSFVHWMEKRSIQRSDRLVGVSDYVAREQLALIPGKKPPVTVIFNCVDTEMFSPGNVEQQDGLIVFVNAIDYRKGAHTLFKAFDQIGAKYPHTRLALGGVPAKISGKPITDELLPLVRPEVRKRIDFLGWQSKEQVRDLLRKAHVCCYPSLLETFGVAPVEAMAVGKPVIYSNRGPGPELIEQGTSGFLCDPENPQDLAAKIESVLTDPALAKRMGDEARQRALNLFAKSKWIDTNLRFYEQCVTTRS